MNEQLIVKNFGPIKDATVDFKRVTVFIGPTGGGKSTLAKLAAAFWGGQVRINKNIANIDEALKQLNILNYKFENSFVQWINANGDNLVIDKEISIPKESSQSFLDIEVTEELIDRLTNQFINNRALKDNTKDDIRDLFMNILVGDVLNSRLSSSDRPYEINYIPTERVFLPAIEYSWAGLMRDDIGLPKLLLQFANEFSLHKQRVLELDVPFLDVRYIHKDGRDFIKIPNRETLLALFETASGIQSVVPMMVLLEYLSRNIVHAKSFIIEEPELNIYPIAQQQLLNWLISRCTKGGDELTITTHSPYILSSCNLLLEAYKVAQQRPELAEEIAAIVPKECWINPDEFASYYVADGTVKSITDVRTHLIGANELDAVSGDIADSFRKLLRLQKQKQPSA